MFCSYVFSTVQRYGDFRTPTIPPLGHSIYHQYGINPNPPAASFSVYIQDAVTIDGCR